MSASTCLPQVIPDLAFYPAATNQKRLFIDSNFDVIAYDSVASAKGPNRRIPFETSGSYVTGKTAVHFAKCLFELLHEYFFWFRIVDYKLTAHSNMFLN
jgi:hypothetical protein